MSTNAAPTSPPAFPPALAADQIHALRDMAVDWSLAHGLVIRALGSGPDGKSALSHSAVHAPIALFPSPFPKAGFEQARRLQPVFNTLVHEITKDSGFLSEVMDGIGDVDPFTSRLYSIYRRQLAAGLPAQSISLGVHRSDYLLHKASPTTPPTIQQVELNTIASSFGCLSSLTTGLHQYLSSKTDFYNKRDNPSTFDIVPEALPANGAREAIAGGIAEAHREYVKQQAADAEAVVVMVVQPGERNAMDQRWIEYELIERYGIKLFRRTLAEMHQSGSVSSERKLVIQTFNGPRPVSVVYFRAGYGPSDYPTDAEWSARSLIESSIAVKCPTVAQQLAGAKKVQQVLALPGQLERFLPAHDAALLRTCFTGLYSLDAGTAEGDQAFAMALKDPLKYVVKPQREGGGNNVYQADIPQFLQSLAPNERAAYILMELIEPPPMRNVLVRQGEVIQDAEVVSELGIYGIWVANGDHVVKNEAGGHLLRTKVASSHEGGVAAGFAVLDSPLLY
ncbi:glutathione synthase [Catenaria anguillulae PL171]|uniref:Glutathione synthetase n=1 Tax=Catenaria anguillulae PL171 TaxID=765915 RepID=A0A1Y2HFS8_9FUNG|nr:glutathione synthase [Catenaria anguillulae PL171]